MPPGTVHRTGLNPLVAIPKRPPRPPQVQPNDAPIAGLPAAGPSSSATSNAARSPSAAADAPTTPCIHEDGYLRCPLLRPDPDERGRLTQVRDNPLDRIAEAETNRWFSEVEGVKVSLAGARDKLAQMDQIATRCDTAVHLGIPTFSDAAGRAGRSGPDHNQTH